MRLQSIILVVLPLLLFCFVYIVAYTLLQEEESTPRTYIVTCAGGMSKSDGSPQVDTITTNTYLYMGRTTYGIGQNYYPTALCSVRTIV